MQFKYAILLCALYGAFTPQAELYADSPNNSTVMIGDETMAGAEYRRGFFQADFPSEEDLRLGQLWICDSGPVIEWRPIYTPYMVPLGLDPYNLTFERYSDKGQFRSIKRSPEDNKPKQYGQELFEFMENGSFVAKYLSHAFFCYDEEESAASFRIHEGVLYGELVFITGRDLRCRKPAPPSGPKPHGRYPGLNPRYAVGYIQCKPSAVVVEPAPKS